MFTLWEDNAKWARVETDVSGSEEDGILELKKGEIIKILKVDYEGIHDLHGLVVKL